MIHYSLFIALILTFFVSAATANPLLGTWHSPIFREESPTAWLDFRADNTCWVGTTVPKVDRPVLSIELFRELLSDLGLTVAELEKLGFKFPIVDLVVIEGRYTVEDDFLTIELTEYLLGIEGDNLLVDLGQFYADTAHSLLELLNRETIDLKVIITLTALVESSSQIADLVVGGIMEEGPFVASSFTIQEDRLRFHEGDLAGVGYIRQEDATSVRTTSWGQIKGRMMYEQERGEN